VSSEQGNSCRVRACWWLQLMCTRSSFLPPALATNLQTHRHIYIHINNQGWTGQQLAAQPHATAVSAACQELQLVEEQTLHSDAYSADMHYVGYMQRCP
jgi:hypothetical protein